MMRGIIVFITAILAVLFLKRKQYVHHWTALSMIIFGVFLVGLATQVEATGGGNYSKTDPLGIILLIISQLFTGMHFIVEEKLLGNYYIHPLKVVGWEGFWGVLLFLIILPIFQFIKCADPKICPYGYLEDSNLAFT